ncbi:MAG: DUF411 domain-containing protein [Pseudomonadota bacterium]
MRKLKILFPWLAAMLWAVSAGAYAAEITVYKSPTCGCCKLWIDHLKSNGFTVKAHDTENVAAHKQRLGVLPELASCHTAVVNGYVIEGHVPAADIKRLLKEKPKILGLAVPGMPMGSPGMEGPVKEAYEVKTFDKKGRVTTYARH